MSLTPDPPGPHDNNIQPGPSPRPDGWHEHNYAICHHCAEYRAIMYIIGSSRLLSLCRQCYSDYQARKQFLDNLADKTIVGTCLFLTFLSSVVMGWILCDLIKRWLP